MSRSMLVACWLAAAIDGAFSQPRGASTPPVALYLQESPVPTSYLGGTSKPTRGDAIAIDAAGNLLIAGRTEARDFPTVASAQKKHGGGINDAFIAKFAPGGRLLYSTFMGGKEVELAEDIAVDHRGNAYVAGTTYSTNFPTSSTAVQRKFGGGDRDCFVVKLGPDGSVLYATLIGGNGTDRCMAVAVDAEGNAYVTGSTNSTDLMPSKVSGSIGAEKDWDIFVSKLDPGGTQRLYSTRFGGTAGRQTKPGGMGGESGTDIAVDAGGRVFVSGYTDSEDFPIRGGRQTRFGGGPADAVIASLDPSGATLLASTYLGGTDRDSAAAIALDSSGHVLVAGETSSPDFPTENPFYARRVPSGFAYVARLTGQLNGFVYSTYLGGFAGGIAVDNRGIAYVLGLSSVASVTSAGDSILISPVFASDLRGEGIAVDPWGQVWITGISHVHTSRTADRRAAVWHGKAR